MRRAVVQGTGHPVPPGGSVAWFDSANDGTMKFKAPGGPARTSEYITLKAFANSSPGREHAGEIGVETVGARTADRFCVKTNL
jgi:hypothetical protein